MFRNEAAKNNEKMEQVKPLMSQKIEHLIIDRLDELDSYNKFGLDNIREIVNTLKQLNIDNNSSIASFNNVR